jgi:hypothetical protein
MAYNEQKVLEALHNLETVGYYKTNVVDILDSSGIESFNKASDFYDQMLSNPEIQYQLETIKQGLNIKNKDKFYEITHYDYLNRGLSLQDGDLFNLYLNDYFIELSTRFLKIDPLIYNVLFWIHGERPLGRSGSQNWHRDGEDYKLMKVFIYYHDVEEENGALQYVPNSYCGGNFILNQGKTTFEDYIYSNGGSYNMTSEQTEICNNAAVTFKGTVGDVIITNNSGYHRGGLVSKGFRCMSHALYLRPDAIWLRNGLNINYDPTVNQINPNSQDYINLKEKQKYLKIY